MRSTSRLVLVALTLLAIALFYVPLGHADYTGRWGEGTYGVDVLRAGGARIDSVAKGSPAYTAGVRPGDAIAGAPFTMRWSELGFPHAGERRSFRFRHPNGTEYAVSLTAVPVDGFGVWNRIGGVLAVVPATIFLVVAFALVFLRPGVMTWSFFAYAIGYFSTSPAFEFYAGVLPPPWYFAMTFLLSTFAGNFAVITLLPFVLRFPDDRVDGWRKRVDRLIWVAAAVSFAAYSYQWYLQWSTGGEAPFSAFLDTWLPLAVFVTAALIVTKKFKTVPAAQRQRVGFLVMGLIISFVAYAVYFIPTVPANVAQIVGYAVALMPIGVAYGVLRHRVLDVNFVLNRAIAYGILSLLVIAVVSLLDWLLSRVVSEQRLTTGIEVLVTIGIGFLLDRINRFIESFVEVVLFRQRRQAEAYVRRAAEALPYATDESAITDGLAEVPVEALELAASAVYRRSFDGSRFEGIATSRETPMAPAGFEANNLLVRMLRSSEKLIWLDEVRSHLDAENAAIYVVAVPVSIRHELVSFTLYGAHKNGAQLDPDEVRLLEELAREASRAYDHVEAVRTRARYGVTMAASPETA